LGSTALTATSPSKRPRATNGAEVFAKEHKVRITERMAEKQDQEGGTLIDEKTGAVNLMRYRTAKQELYDQLTDKERHAYEAKASETNEVLKALPETSETFE
jgi:hypothetical protein